MSSPLLAKAAPAAPDPVAPDPVAAVRTPRTLTLEEHAARERFRSENTQEIDWYNRLVAEHGVFGDDLRVW